MIRRCGRCGGGVRLVRVEPHDAERVVEHYRCAPASGCRSGGARVLERGDDRVVATDGPIFRGDRP